jgi:uncharacterized protein YgiM (DUF1202 family)
VSWLSVLLGCLLLCSAGLSPLLAATTHYITSAGTLLNIRSGPGTEYAVVMRLPHGSKVVLHEIWGKWARISPLQGSSEGWVLQSYLTAAPPADSETQSDMSPEQERRRFTRLQRKGIMVIQPSTTPGILRLTMNPLVWYRLTPPQQENFLRRAQRRFKRRQVEMHDQRNNALLARLNATGEVEFVTQPAADQPPSDAAAASEFTPPAH